MTNKDTLFFAEMYSLVRKMEETIEEFDMKERVLAAIVVGVIDTESIDEENLEAEMKSMYSFNVECEEELDSIKRIMDIAYKKDEEDDDDIDLSDLLDGLGISLN